MSFLVISLFLLGFTQPILNLFGSDFIAARWVLLTLIVGKLINAFTGPVGYLLDLTGYQNQSALIRSCSTLVNVILNFIAIPLFGMLGAAIATALTFGIEKLWIQLFAYKKLGIYASIFTPLTLPNKIP